MWATDATWWYWWLGLGVVFFLLPLAYGWAYRGWGPWYRWRSRSARVVDRVSSPSPRATGDALRTWAGLVLWIVLLIVLVWPVAVAIWSM
jgi:hypothetical protein